LHAVEHASYQRDITQDIQRNIVDLESRHRDTNIRSDYRSADNEIKDSISQEESERKLEDTAIRTDYVSEDIAIKKRIDDEVALLLSKDAAIKSEYERKDNAITDMIIAEKAKETTRNFNSEQKDNYILESLNELYTVVFRDHRAPANGLPNNRFLNKRSGPTEAPTLTERGKGGDTVVGVDGGHAHFNSSFASIEDTLGYSKFVNFRLGTGRQGDTEYRHNKKFIPVRYGGTVPDMNDYQSIDAPGLWGAFEREQRHLEYVYGLIDYTSVAEDGNDGDEEEENRGGLYRSFPSRWKAINKASNGGSDPTHPAAKPQPGENAIFNDEGVVIQTVGKAILFLDGMAKSSKVTLAKVWDNDDSWTVDQLNAGVDELGNPIGEMGLKDAPAGDLTLIKVTNALVKHINGLVRKVGILEQRLNNIDDTFGNGRLPAVEADANANAGLIDGLAGRLNNIDNVVDGRLPAVEKKAGDNEDNIATLVGKIQEEQAKHDVHETERGNIGALLQQVSELVTLHATHIR
jgi:hypothetical protein